MPNKELGKAVNNNETIVTVDCTKFLSFEGEKILIAVNKHILTLFPSFITLGFVIIFLEAIVVVGGFYINSLLFLITGTTAVMLISIIVLIHTLIESYYHIYIVTNRKVLEIAAIPFVGISDSQIMLDQVKCTELDMHTEGFIYNLFDIGNITLTFDRPISQQALVLSSIKKYREAGTILSQLVVKDTEQIQKNQQNQTEEVWYKTEDQNSKYRFMEETNVIPAKKSSYG